MFAAKNRAWFAYTPPTKLSQEEEMRKDFLIPKTASR